MQRIAGFATTPHFASTCHRSMVGWGASRTEAGAVLASPRSRLPGVPCRCSRRMGERPAWQRSPYLAPVGQTAMALVGLFLLAPQASGWLRALVLLGSV